jgi:hypothetical protein
MTSHGLIRIKIVKTDCNLNLKDFLFSPKFGTFKGIPSFGI